MTGPYPLGDRIERVVARQAGRDPAAIALRQGDHHLSYGELVERAASVASGLADLGVVPGQHVAVRMARTPDLVVALLGVLQAGAAYLAVDPSWPQARVAEALRRASVGLCITDVSGPLPVRSVGLAVLHGAPRPLADTGDGTATASIFFTSGSTGTPKGVLSPHRGTIRTVVGCPTIPVDQDTVFFQAAPLPWDALSLELWAPLLNGGCCVLLDPDLPAPDADALQTAVRQGVNSLWLTSSLFAVMAEERVELFGGVRLLLVGGERVPVAAARRVLARFPNLHMVNGYGPVESTIFATSHVIRAADVAADSTEIPIGRPLPRTSVVLLGPDGRPVTDGAIGEVAVGGDGVALGYAGDPEETERRFFTADGTRFYRTGDLALVDAEGLLRYRGRADHQFKIRGVRIEAGEVEAVLEQHRGIAASCVLPLGTVPGRVRLAAAYTTTGTPAPTEPEIRAHAADLLLPAMIPTLLVHVDRLPLSANGKIDRTAVRELLAQRCADAVGDAQPADTCELVREVRELVDIARLDEQDDLLGAGASSLDLIRLAARLSSRLRVRLTVADVYRLRTVAAIAAFAAAAPTTPSPTDLGPGAGPVPLSHAQQRFWLAEMSAPGQADNMIVLAYALTGPLRTDHLDAALAEVVRWHPALRTIYPWRGDAPVQEVIAPEAAAVTIDRVEPPRGTPTHDLQALAEAVTADWWHCPFSLEKEIPLRLRLCRVTDDVHLLCVQVHHIAFDGWSESVLLTDLGAAYEGHLSGTRIGHDRYSAWEATQLAGWLRRDLPFWRERVTRLPPPFLPAPTGWEHAVRGESVLTVAAPTVAALTGVAVRRGAPVLAVLVAAVGRALSRTFQVSDLALGSLSAGRSVSDLDTSIGYYVNPFALTLTAADREDLAGVLDQSVDQVLRALDHVSTPFDELVRELAPARSRHPLFQAWVAVQHQPPHTEFADVVVEPVRVRPPVTALELVVQAVPVPDGAWSVVLAWREDGVNTEQAHTVQRELAAALADLAVLAS